MCAVNLWSLFPNKSRKTMKILVSGATGNVGRLVVEQALARGHEVVALARNPQNLQLEHPNLTTGAVDIS